jgi:hypothetical protein
MTLTILPAAPDAGLMDVIVGCDADGVGGVTDVVRAPPAITGMDTT